MPLPPQDVLLSAGFSPSSLAFREIGEFSKSSTMVPDTVKQREGVREEDTKPATKRGGSVKGRIGQFMGFLI
jgi:hypothetical protein